MATVTLHPDPQLLPIGTTVKVYERPANAPASWLPSGAALSEPTVEAGTTASTLTVTGLTVGKNYVAEATVSGQRRALNFNGGEAAAEGSGVTSINGKSGAVTLSAADVEAIGTESPAFTGVPTAPTAAGTTNTTQLATTAFSKARATAAQEAAESAAGTKDAALKTEAESKDTAARKAAEEASRPAATAIPFITRETFAVAAAVEAGTLPGPVEIAMAAGETQKLVKIGLRIREGTKVKGKLQRNGEDVTGATLLEATTTASLTTLGTPVTLAAKDRLAFVIESVEGSPKGLSVTLHVEHLV